MIVMINILVLIQKNMWSIVYIFKHFKSILMFFKGMNISLFPIFFRTDIHKSSIFWNNKWFLKMFIKNFFFSFDPLSLSLLTTNLVKRSRCNSCPYWFFHHDSISLNLMYPTFFTLLVKRTVIITMILLIFAFKGKLFFIRYFPLFDHTLTTVI